MTQYTFSKTNTTARLDLCESITGYSFTSKPILLEALNLSTSRGISIGLTYGNVVYKIRGNDYIAVKGDAVLNCLIEQAWWRSGAPPYVHDIIVRERTSLETLHTIGKDTGLDACLVTSNDQYVITRPDMAAALKAIIAAVQVDGGWEAAEKVAQKLGLLKHAYLEPGEGSWVERFETAEMRAEDIIRRASFESFT
ncbi:hypothetical protein P154DRAFT_614474 [Amniculicola lignicola CBS 123094]|uniref:Uncharacterized protein n=1 Tax=Amniculicola lignicola CBS 123094 TaxID=1392246 RepID=A0A6A5X569_9PLEO|nr:hypothetical protein P154DRAFT_614474 [Amniculicola lignicola CBS 123094]